MNDKLREIRKKLEMTQKEFGQSLGVSRDTYASYESGRVIPSETFLQLLSKTYNVNYEWLTDNKGDMFITKPNDIIDSLVQEYGFGNVEKAILTEYIALDDDGKKTLMSFIMKIGETAKRFDKDSWLVGDKNFKSWESATEEDIKIAEEILREEKERKDKGGA